MKKFLVNVYRILRKCACEDTAVTGTKKIDFTKDMNEKDGYRKSYTHSLRVLINHLNGLIEHETHDELRNEYKSLLVSVTNRLQAIYAMFN